MRQATTARLQDSLLRRLEQSTGALYLLTSPTAPVQPGWCRGARWSALYGGCPAPFRWLWPSSGLLHAGHRGEVVAREGTARLEVALPGLADPEGSVRGRSPAMGRVGRVIVG